MARLELDEPLEDYLQRHGRPIRYGYVREPLAARRLPDRLRARARERRDAERGPAVHDRAGDRARRRAGILVAPVTLHTGVSSPERGEPPYPERYRVPDATARLVNAVHGWGGRVIAVGTTVVRALETAAAADGRSRAARAGRASSSRPSAGCARSTACSPAGTSHDSSHLQLLEAAAGADLLERSYAAARRARLPVARVRRRPPDPALTKHVSSGSTTSRSRSATSTRRWRSTGSSSSSRCAAVAPAPRSSTSATSSSR